MGVTMSDVAKEAGVSLSLASLAFRDAYGVNKDTRDRILTVARRMGYQPNAVAARLASKADTTLGVYLLDLRNEVYIDIHDGVREVGEAAGRELMLTVGSTTGTLDRPALDSMLRARVGTVVALGLLLSDDELAAYRGRLRLVSVSRVVPGFDAVTSDSTLGSRLAVDHLTGLGHRRILHLANVPSDGYRDRTAGYETAMRAHRLEPRSIEVGYSREQARHTMQQVLDGADPPTAVFAHNDQMALGVLDAATARGLRVPHDLSVVGYDNISLADTPGVRLTTVDVDSVDLGRRAARLALRPQQDDDGTVETLSPHLLVRESTAAPVL